MTIAVFTAAILATQAPMTILPPADTGDLYVGNFAGDNVLVYDASGGFLRSFTSPDLDQPRGIAFGPNEVIYVASQSQNAIHMFDVQENFLGSFNAPDELISPTGMAIGPNDELYVGSFNNDQIVVFDLAGNFQRSFTGVGLNGPNCVMFDANDDIYVSSALSAEVLKFDADENYLFSFTASGLSSPMSIARRPGAIERLYVSSGGNDRIYVFDTAGNSMVPSFITHPDLSGAQGVALDDQGHLWSCSFFGNTVVEFDDTDTYVQTVTTGGLDTPRSMAFAQFDSGPVPTMSACGMGMMTAMLLSAAAMTIARRRRE